MRKPGMEKWREGGWARVFRGSYHHFGSDYNIYLDAILKGGREPTSEKIRDFPTIVAK